MPVQPSSGSLDSFGRCSTFAVREGSPDSRRRAWPRPLRRTHHASWPRGPRRTARKAAPMPVQPSSGSLDSFARCSTFAVREGSPDSRTFRPVIPDSLTSRYG